MSVPCVDNRAAQIEELEVLQSIYGTDCSVQPDNQYVEVRLLGDGAAEAAPLVLQVHLSNDYPSMAAPVAEVSAPWLSEASRGRAWQGLQDVWAGAVGEVVVFSWAEWLKEQDWLVAEQSVWLEAQQQQQEASWRPDGGGIHMSGAGAASFSAGDGQSAQIPGRKTGHRGEGSYHGRNVRGTGHVDGAAGGEEGEMQEEQQEAAAAAAMEAMEHSLGIVHGAPFTERKSTFQAHLAPVQSAEDVEKVMEVLLQNRKIAAATHNIMAFRITITLASGKNTVLQDYDDDGEAAAGGRLLHLLQITDAKNVAVVVSRWYGGVQLGPARFQHINNAARSLLVSCGAIGHASNNSSSSSSKSNPTGHHLHHHQQQQQQQQQQGQKGRLGKTGGASTVINSSSKGRRK